MAVVSQRADYLPPELFGAIMDCLPLHAYPSTLLALSLTNRNISQKTSSLLRSRIILHNERNAVNFLQRILANPQLGYSTRELHIRSEASSDTEQGRTPFDVITGLKKVVQAGALPNLHSLGIHFLTGWHHIYKPGFGSPLSDFCDVVAEKCPRFSGLTLKDDCDNELERYLDGECGIFKLKRMECIHLEFTHGSSNWNAMQQLTLTKNIVANASMLTTLVLQINREDTYFDPEPLLRCHFPKLKKLKFGCVRDVDLVEAMKFWKRNPTIESFDVLDYWRDGVAYFDSNALIQQGFLPNLKFLIADINNVIALVPILSQLVSLVVDCATGQGLRYFTFNCVLQNLRSLSVVQGNAPRAREALGLRMFIEEDLELDPDYLQAIIRSAPNLEELAFRSIVKLTMRVRLESAVPLLSQLSRLKRFYFSFTGKGVSATQTGMDDMKVFLSDARLLGEKCPFLESVTSIQGEKTDMPYLKAHVIRDAEGSVLDVTRGLGYGMEIGREDEPFPTGYYCTEW